MNKFTHQCPVLVAVVHEQQNFMSTVGSMIKNKNYALFDIGIAVNQFCLQAADLGLGTCIIGWFDEKKIKKILGVRRRRIPLLISVGYPDAPIREKVRKPLDVMSSWNQY
jgi:nitroreductase